MAVKIEIVGGPGRIETKQIIGNSKVASQLIATTIAVCQNCVYYKECDPSSLHSRRRMVAIIGDDKYCGAKGKCALLGKEIIV